MHGEYKAKHDVTHLCNHLFQTEKYYNQCLHEAVNLFLRPLEAASCAASVGLKKKLILTNQQIHELFHNLEQILTLSDEFLAGLVEIFSSSQAARTPMPAAQLDQVGGGGTIRAAPSSSSSSSSSSDINYLSYNHDDLQRLFSRVIPFMKMYIEFAQGMDRAQLLLIQARKGDLPRF